MAEVKWIKITTNIFDDEKIKLIESMPDGDAIIVIWFKLLTLCGRINSGGGALVMKGTNIPYTEDMLATLLNRDVINIRYALQTFEKFGMVEIENESIVIANWEKHQNVEGLEKIKKSNAERQKRFREKKKQKELTASVQETDKNNKHNVTHNVMRNVTVTEENCYSNRTELELDKDINNNIISSKNDANNNKLENIITAMLDVHKIDEANKKNIITILSDLGKDEWYLREKIRLTITKGKVKDNIGFLIEALKGDWKS